MPQPAARNRIVSHPAVLRSLDVLDVDDLGPHARRVVVGGDQLGAFTVEGRDRPAFSSPGPEDHVKLVLPASPGAPVILPSEVDGKLVWPTDPAPTRRDVSVRHLDATAGRLVFEVVRHGGDGPLAAWAERVEPGDRIHLTGPRSSRLMVDAAHFVLVGDLASLAAVARWTAEVPPASAVTALVSVPGPDDERPIVRPDGGELEVRWFHGTDDRVLLDALSDVDPGPNPFVFVGAENDIAKAAREHLRDRRGLTARQFRCIGYWRAGTPASGR